MNQLVVTLFVGAVAVHNLEYRWTPNLYLPAIIGVFLGVLFLTCVKMLLRARSHYLGNRRIRDRTLRL